MDHNYAHHPSLLLSLLFNFSGSRYWDWVEAFDSAVTLINTPANELQQLSLQAKHLLQCYQARGEDSELAQRARKIVTQINRHNAAIIAHDDDRYPPLLRQIHRPPPLLFIKGNADLLSMPQIAIVGSRHATNRGLQNSYDFAAFLAEHGFTITSGLAIGIDGAAHRGALTVTGKTIGVMATGIDSIYPRKHRSLAETIIDTGGALITEFFPGATVKPRHFPQRNRIISGLCAGVLVVEAAVKSGSLITARYALEQGREVFAIPDSIHNPQSKGTHALIKEGAHLVENANDIVEELDSFLYNYRQHGSPQLSLFESLATPSGQEKQPPIKEADSLITNPKISTEKTREPCSDKESLLLENISSKPVTIDQLAAYTELPTAEISALLISLELKDYISVSEWGYERKIL